MLSRPPHSTAPPSLRVLGTLALKGFLDFTYVLSATNSPNVDHAARALPMFSRGTPQFLGATKVLVDHRHGLGLEPGDGVPVNVQGRRGLSAYPGGI